MCSHTNSSPELEGLSQTKTTSSENGQLEVSMIIRQTILKILKSAKEREINPVSIRIPRTLCTSLIALLSSPLHLFNSFSFFTHLIIQQLLKIQHIH